MAPGVLGVEFQNNHLLAKLYFVKPESYLWVEGVLSPEPQLPPTPGSPRGLFRKEDREVGAKI